MVLLSLQNISFTYPKGPSIFESMSLDIMEGEMLGVLGPNGCGKSTLFDLITQYHRPKDGVMLYRGLPLEESTFFQEVGCVFQNISLDPYLTVYENLWMQGSLYKIPRKQLAQRIHDLADQFQFKELIERQARLLSGGYARRVEIAKALIAKPAFILLDEPSTGLDPKSRLDLFAWLRSIQKENGTTVVWISHLTDEVQRMDRVVMLHQGHVVCDGQPSQLIGQLQYFYISAKLKDASVVERLETVAENVSLQGEDLQLRINKSDLELVISFLVPCVEHFMYREANLEDVYLEKTGVPIL